MSGSEAHRLIQSMRRQFLLASVTRSTLLVVVALGFVFGSMWRADANYRAETMWAISSVAAIAWVVLTFYSVRQVRAAHQASAFIASGRLDLAEERLKRTLRQFSLYRNAKLLACHHLAVVAHGRKSYQAAAELCDGMISLPGGPSVATLRTCRILLADCRLLLGDVVAARDAIAPLNLQGSELNLAEQLLLLPIELRCQLTAEQYDAACESLPWKLKRAELLDSPTAGLVHALLAVAANHIGRSRMADFLRRRADLYHGLEKLAEEHDFLRDLAPEAISADNKGLI